MAFTEADAARRKMTEMNLIVDNYDRELTANLLPCLVTKMVWSELRRSRRRSLSYLKVTVPECRILDRVCPIIKGKPRYALLGKQWRSRAIDNLRSTDGSSQACAFFSEDSHPVLFWVFFFAPQGQGHSWYSLRFSKEWIVLAPGTVRGLILDRN